MPSLGIWELLLIFGIVLLLFGGRKMKSALPDIASGIGGAIRTFKSSLKEPEENPKTLTGEKVEATDSPAETKNSTQA